MRHAPHFSHSGSSPHVRETTFSTPSNQSYQMQMADSLVTSMGTQDAVSFALENGWDGIADRIMRSTKVISTH